MTGVKSLSEFNLHSLKVCVVEFCNHLKNIVNRYTTNVIEGIVEESSSGVLQNLEKLYLYDLQPLQCIWEGPVLSESLINLVVLTLHGYPKFTMIFDPALARTLPSIKHLKVEKCCETLHIIEVPEGSNNLELIDLYNILKIWRMLNSQTCPN